MDCITLSHSAYDALATHLAPDAIGNVLVEAAALRFHGIRPHSGDGFQDALAAVVADMPDCYMHDATDDADRDTGFDDSDLEQLAHIIDEMEAREND